MLKQAVIITLLTAGLGVSAANAAGSPLDPSYQFHTAAMFAVAPAGATDIDATRNPLTPSFYQANVKKVVTRNGTWYDAAGNNPLHPSYSRS